MKKYKLICDRSHEHFTNVQVTHSVCKYKGFFVGYDTFYYNECGQFNQNLLYLGTEGV